MPCRVTPVLIVGVFFFDNYYYVHRGWQLVVACSRTPHRHACRRERRRRSAVKSNAACRYGARIAEGGIAEVVLKLWEHDVPVVDEVHEGVEQAQYQPHRGHPLTRPLIAAVSSEADHAQDDRKDWEYPDLVGEDAQQPEDEPCHRHLAERPARAG